MRECRIIAHRGANVSAPQNTMPAFRKAVEAGADGFETDVHLTKDGIPVICHNYTIDDTSSGHGRIDEMTLEELRALDFGTWFDASFAGTQIPTLDEFLSFFAQNRQLQVMNLELKCPRRNLHGLVKKTLDAVESYGLTEKLLISGFSVRVLREVRRVNPAVKTAFLYPSTNLRTNLPRFVPLDAVRRLHLQALHPYFKLVFPGLVAAAHKTGADVNVWTVNDENEIRRLVMLGVDGLITDDPANTRRIMESCYCFIRK